MTKKVRKVYQSISYPHYYTSVFIDGNEIRIGFVGAVRFGSLQIFGRYTTSDQKVQEALEKSPSFNVDYKIIQTIEEQGKDDILNDNDSPDKNPDQFHNPIGEDNQNQEKRETVKAPEVIRIQDARDWLREHFKEITFDQVRSRDSILKLARKYKVKFSNLK